MEMITKDLQEGAEEVDVTKAIDTLTEGFEAWKVEQAAALEVVKNFDPSKLTARLDKVEAAVKRPAVITDRKDEPTDEMKAFGAYLRKGEAGLTLERKTLLVGTDPSGGYLAPAEFSTELVRNLTQFSPVRMIASVRVTGAPSVRYPTRTGITNATWVGEIATRSPSEPAFGQIDIPVNEIATYVDISNQLLEDSAGAAEQEVRLALAEDFAKKEGTAFVSGDGVAKPQGFMQSTVTAVAGGNASAITADGLINAFYALPAAYRANATWVMNSTTIAAIRKLKDGSTGAYLWQPGLVAGTPETILGRPVVDMVDMPDISTDTYPIAFGDFAQAYRIVDRVQISVLVDPYSQATSGITRIHARRRVGGGLIKTEALRRIKIASSV